MKSKKGQEEIVGFVVIVLIVVIAGVFLLAFSLRNNTATVTESSEVRQFLDSMLQYTGNCTTNPSGGSNELKDNIIACADDENSACLSDESVCDVAEANAKLLLEASFKASNETAIRGYEFKAGEKGTNNSIINITKGDCSGSYKADELPLMTSLGNKLRISLKLCS
jgi:hypothetical protein